MRRVLGIIFLAGALLHVGPAHAFVLDGGSFAKTTQQSALIHVDLSPDGTSAVTRSTWLCAGHYYFDVTTRAEGRRHGNELHFTGHGTIKLVKGRARYRTDLRLRLGDQAADGTITINGTLPGRTHRHTCAPQRTTVRLRRQPVQPAAGARPQPNARYYGSANLRTVHGRVEGMWTADLRCRALYGGTADNESLVDFTPKMTATRTGRFAEHQTYADNFPKVIYRYSVHFKGGFTGNGAHGVGRAQLNIVDRATGKTFIKCHGGSRWTAVRSNAHTTIPNTMHQTAKDWHLELGGTDGTFTAGSPDILGVAFDRRHFRATVTHDGTSIALLLDAGDGRTLEKGRTYTDTQSAHGPSLAVSGFGTPCAQGSTGRFAVTDATYDLQGFPKTYAVSFTAVCGETTRTGALRLSR